MGLGTSWVVGRKVTRYQQCDSLTTSEAFLDADESLISLLRCNRLQHGLRELSQI